MSTLQTIRRFLIFTVALAVVTILVLHRNIVVFQYASRDNEERFDADVRRQAIAPFFSDRNNRGTKLHSPSDVFLPWNEKWPDQPLPCIVELREDPNWTPLEETQMQPSDKGILFVKIHKAASTTLASVALRIAQAMYHRTFNETTHMLPNGRALPEHQQFCVVRSAHEWSLRTTKYSDRNHQKSFLYSFLKKPAKRLVSSYYYFFFDIPGRRRPPNGYRLLKYLVRERNSQLGIYIMDKEPKEHRDIKNMSKAQLKQLVQTSMNEFDFLGIVERLDESLVVLQLLLGLNPSDVLYPTASKASGGYIYRDKAGYKKQCMNVPKPPIKPKVRAFLKSEKWAELNYGDNFLYEAANAKLERTIDQVIGRDKFNHALAEFQKVKAYAHNKACSSPRLACTSNGTMIPEEERDLCYREDIGCGYECLNTAFPFQRNGPAMPLR